ncbi:MAG: hypothetical protein R6U78_14765 [Bacteroidales bacterium]
MYNPTVEAFDDPGSGEVTVSTIRLDLLESTGEDVILMIQHFTAGDADFFAALFMYNAGAVTFIRTNGKEGQKMAHMRHYTKTFRFQDELGGFLEAEAQRQNRSVNNLVETLIMDSYAYRMRFGHKLQTSS